MTPELPQTLGEAISMSTMTTEEAETLRKAQEEAQDTREERRARRQPLLTTNSGINIALAVMLMGAAWKLSEQFKEMDEKSQAQFSSLTEKIQTQYVSKELFQSEFSALRREQENNLRMVNDKLSDVRAALAALQASGERRGMHNKILTVLLAVTVTLILGVCFQVSRLAPSIATKIAVQMEPATATWLSGGVTITVTTVQDTTSSPPETVAHWAARHRERVDAMLKAFPKDA